MPSSFDIMSKCRVVSSTPLDLLTSICTIKYMGSYLWNLEYLIQMFAKPMITAYVFGQYRMAAFLLFQLNSLLMGFGEGVDQLPIPRHISKGVMDRAIPSVDYQAYYEKYSNVVVLKMGKYCRSILDVVRSQNAEPQEQFVADDELEL